MATSKTAAVLQGKKVVVIGGTSGLGFAAASALIEEGVSVIIASSSADRVTAAITKLSDPAQQYNADASRVSGHALNLKGPTAEENLKEFFSKVGSFDHLLYTAGDSIAAKPLQEWSYEDIVNAGSVRFISAVLAIKVATGSPDYLKRNGGSIVLTTGVVAEKPLPNWSVVASYASGLYGLTRNLALDLAPLGIRINAISPGPVETELWAGIPEKERKEFLKATGDKLMTGKVGQPEDVANAYVYLLKDKNMTAQVVTSDAGSSVADRQ
ncbi:NAD(P)-binding domain protein [Kalmanozyma brasiliensis GHG001]|uniref:Uncharacterized protein n=1 Tax=Kalmanozyma brasiliensis (strain GHG001) TaxID=1365824 RepID=V5EX67_KALBG|nr:NAD(P)-binding domain protein [Kalmanozyma brasiliensis GHG001]EST06994.1 NAD(P)-binding domain protein [Kalmanozyma brasiliensis GHG001]